MIFLRNLRERLLEQTREHVRNGDVTERRLARLTGISQPHIHHVLKGTRTLTPAVFDSLLEELGLSVLDLLTPEELEAEIRKRSPGRRGG